MTQACKRSRDHLQLVHDTAWEAAAFKDTNALVTVQEGQLVCSALKGLTEKLGFRESSQDRNKLGWAEAPTEVPLFGKLIASATYDDVDPHKRSAELYLQAPDARGNTTEIVVTIGAEPDDVSYFRMSRNPQGHPVEGSGSIRKQVTSGELLEAYNLTADAHAQPRLATMTPHEEALAGLRLGIPFAPNLPAEQ